MYFFMYTLEKRSVISEKTQFWLPLSKFNIYIPVSSTVILPSLLPICLQKQPDEHYLKKQFDFSKSLLIYHANFILWFTANIL